MKARSVKFAALTSLCLGLGLGGCSRNERPVISVPVARPCVDGAIPEEPARIDGTLTGDSGRDIGIIAAGEKEARAWGRALHGMLIACRA